MTDNCLKSGSFAIEIRSIPLYTADTSKQRTLDLRPELSAIRRNSLVYKIVCYSVNLRLRIKVSKHKNSHSSSKIMSNVGFHLFGEGRTFIFKYLKNRSTFRKVKTFTCAYLKKAINLFNAYRFRHSRVVISNYVTSYIR